MKPPSEQIHSGSSLHRGGCFSCNHFESYLSWLLIIIGINWEHQESVDLICWINFGVSLILSNAFESVKIAKILSNPFFFFVCQKLFCTLLENMRDVYEEETKIISLMQCSEGRNMEPQRKMRNICRFSIK